MERLSNIMKTGQGSAPAGQQRVPPGQRQPTSARHPLAERDEHQGASVRQSGGLYRSRPAPRVPEMRDEVWEEPEQPPMRPAHTRATYGSQRFSRIPQSARYVEQPPQGDYYEEDERATVVPADAQDVWSDDTAGMRYGDWENAPGYSNAPNYEDEEEFEPPTPAPRLRASRPPTQELSSAAQRLIQQRRGNDPLATRELYRVTSEGAQSLPPSARETRLPVPTSGSRLTSTQAAQRLPQRTTQPLKPQRVARVPHLRNEMQRHPPRPQQATFPAASPEGSADFTITVNNPQSVCPLCKGAGFLRANVPFGDPQFGKAVACRCKEQERKRKRRQQLQELSNLGAFANKRFETFNPHVPGTQEAYQAALEFARCPDGWLLLVGPNGCGKTHLAAAIANECLEAGSVVLFATVPDLLDHLRAAFAPDSSEVYDQLFARMREAEVLVLDDLGAQQSSPWANEKLFQLLNYRYNSGFPTVITANPRGEQATDERIRSRLRDFALVTRIDLDRARDYRPNKPRRS